MQKEQHTYKLTYFNMRGRAELSRYIFAYIGVDYEDIRVSDWPKKKPDTRYGQLPELDIDGKTLYQSKCIAKYLASEFGIAGETPMEKARADETVEVVRDLEEKIISATFEKDVDKRETLKKALELEVFPKFMGFFEKTLEENGGTFMVGKSVKWADLSVLDVLDHLPDELALLDFPKLRRHRNMLQWLPKIAEYINNRPKTDF